MSSTGLRNIDTAIQNTNIWLRDLDARLGWNDRQKSYTAMRTVLQALRDELTIEEAAHLGAQLPLILRGVYYEGWSPGKAQSRHERQLDAFLQRVSENYDQAPGPDRIDAVWLARCVFDLLEEHVSAGQIQDVKGILPAEFAILWPEEEESGTRVAQGFEGGQMGQSGQL